jgi:hypothetical protein
MHREFQGSGIPFWAKVLVGIVILKVLLGSGLVWMLLVGGMIWYFAGSCNGRRHEFHNHFDGRKRKREVHVENGKIKNDEVVNL